MTLVGLMRAKPGVSVPEVGDDPHAQDVITEVTERRAAVDRAPVGGKSPVLPESWSRHAGDIKAVILHRGITHAAAGRGLENAGGRDLFDRRVRLKRADDIRHLNAALVGYAGE